MWGMWVGCCGGQAEGASRGQGSGVWGQGLRIEVFLRHIGFMSFRTLVLAAVTLTDPLEGQIRVASPNGRNQVTLQVTGGRLYYSLARDGRALLLPSLLGLEFHGAPPLRDSLRLGERT